MSNFNEALDILTPYAVQNEWVIKTVDGDGTEFPDWLIALENMLEQELKDELPDELRPAYHVVMRAFTKDLDCMRSLSLFDNKIVVKILWGVDENPSEYSFKTQAEADAFLLGVDESNGWLSYEVKSDD